MYCPLIAGKITSLTFIARYTAEGGRNIGASHDAFYLPALPAQKSGLLTCAKKRSDHVLSTEVVWGA